jgi:hypothetical protein
MSTWLQKFSHDLSSLATMIAPRAGHMTTARTIKILSCDFSTTETPIFSSKGAIRM